MKDLGWINGWNGVTPEELVRCRQMNHTTVDTDMGNPKNHGYNTVTTCTICDYQFHCDSSD